LWRAPAAAVSDATDSRAEDCDVHGPRWCARFPLPAAAWPGLPPGHAYL